MAPSNFSCTFSLGIPRGTLLVFARSSMVHLGLSEGLTPYLAFCMIHEYIKGVRQGEGETKESGLLLIEI